MGEPRSYCILVLLVLALAACGLSADRWIRARDSELPPPVAPTLGAGSVSESTLSAPPWVCNRPIPAGKSLAVAVTAPGQATAAGPVPGRPMRDAPSTVWTGERLIADRTAEGYIVFVDFAPSISIATSTWPREKMLSLARFYNRAVLSYYAGVRGFDDLGMWSEAFRISSSAPIMLLYDPQHPQDPQPTAMWSAERIPVITYGPTIRTQTASHGLSLAVHELAHIWDGAHGWALSAGLVQVVQNPGNYPTARACDGGPLEDFAESVTAYLIDGYASNERWSDDDPRFYTRFGVQPDEVWALDRHDYVARLFAGATVAEIREEANALRVPEIPIAQDDRVTPER